jgi:hypothetical protein
MFRRNLPSTRRETGPGRRFASPRLVGILNSWRRARPAVFDFASNDNAIAHGAAFANWTVDVNSSKSAAGIVLTQTGTSDQAVIDIAGLSPSTGYWMKITVDSKSAGMNGNARVVAWDDTGCEIAGSGGVLVNFGSGGALGTFYAKVFTKATSAQPGKFRLVIKHATSPDTNWLRMSEINLFPIPSRTARVSVMGDRTSGYVLATASAVDSAILNANANTQWVVAPGDLADPTNPSYATVNDALKNALVAAGGGIIAAPGNWDYSNSIASFKSYLGLAETYYSRALGEMEFFFYDTNDTHADNDQTSLGAAQNAKMGQWLLNALRQSKARWKVVIIHHPAYTSSTHSPGGYPAMAWDWAGLGVALVIQSHDHVAERILKDGATYFTVGLGGSVAHVFGTPLAESKFRSNTNGYLKLHDSRTDLVVEYYDTAQNLLDRAKISRN